MSISQDRMITLIEEFAILKARYHALLKDIALGHSTNHELLNRYPVFLSEHLAREQEHFRMAARRNQRDADRSRRRRLANGVEPRKTFNFTSEKLAAKNLQPQFTPEAWKDIEPMTYEEAVAQDFSPEALYAMFPDQAPEPPSTKIPDDMFRVD